MYKIQVGQRIIFGAPESVAFEPVLNTSYNAAGMLTFKIPDEAATGLYVSNDNQWDSFWWWEDKTKIVEVLRDKLVIWRGYIRRIEIDIDGIRNVTVEGVLSFFGDSILTPFESDRPMEMREWFEYLVAQHNISVTESPFKNFKVGKIATDVSEDEEDKYRKIEGYQKTKDIIDGIVEKHGGYIYVTYEADGNYINYTLKHESEFANAQTLRYGHNLIDLKFTYNTENLVNLLYPVGDDGITLEVNGFPDYIEDKGSQAKYGVMAQTKQFEGIDDPAELRRVAWKHLDKNSDIRRDIEAVAIDMNAVNINSDRYQVGNLVRIKSHEHQLDDYVRITAIRLDLENPEKSEYTLGNPPDDLYHHIVKNQRLITSPPPQKDDGIIREVPLQKPDNTYDGQFVVPKAAFRADGQWREFWALRETMNVCPLNPRLSVSNADGIAADVKYMWAVERTRLYVDKYPSLQAAKNKIAEFKQTLTPPHPSLSLDDFAAFPMKETLIVGGNEETHYRINEYPTGGVQTPSYHNMPTNYDAVVITWYDPIEKTYELDICGYYNPENVETTSLLMRKKTTAISVDYTMEIEKNSKAKGATIGTQAVARNINTLALGKYNKRGSDDDAIVVGNGTESEPKNSLVIKRNGKILAQDLLLEDDAQKTRYSLSETLGDVKSAINSPLEKADYMTLANKPAFVAKADGILNIYGRFGSNTGRMYLIIKEDGEGAAAYDMVGTPDSYFNITLPILKRKRYTYLNQNVRLDQSYWMPTYFSKVD